MIISSVYLLAAVFSLLLLIAYFITIKKKEPWFFVLFTSISIVNIGYFALSISDTLEGALWANRFSYLGSVLLPLSMFMIILQVLLIGYSKWLPRMLIFISILVFIMAASPGYSDIYYESVSLTQIEGATFLVKDYGPFHALYYVYLAVYFLSMVICLCYKRRKINPNDRLYSNILVSAVFINIAVWLLEQFVDVNFEILSITYIMTGLFLLFLKLLQVEILKIQNDRDKFQIIAGTKSNMVQPAALSAEKENIFINGLSGLTPTEKKIYYMYLQNKTTKEIMGILEIKENTLKYHNKNIYSKLGVSSRKELVAIAKLIKSDKNR